MDRRGVRISRIKVNSLALFEGLLAATIGFVISVVAWFGAVAHYTAQTNSLLQGLLFGLVPGLGAVILATIAYFIVGGIIGYINGFLYNLIAGWMGGVEVAARDVEEPDMTREAPAPSARARRAEPTFGETVDPRRRMDR